MAEQFFPIRSAKQYFREFGVEAIGKKNESKDVVRNQLLESFRKEIFDQITLKFKDPYLLARDISTISKEDKDKVDNIITNSVRKWKRLCILFSNFKETRTVIMPGDLMVSLEEVVQYMKDTYVDGGGESDGVDNSDTDPGVQES